MSNQPTDKCPRCREGRLKNWNELDEEERMIAQRLPPAADYSTSERETMHRWCTRCWHVETRGLIHDA